MEEFSLKLSISPSEKQFRQIVGNDNFEKIKSETFKKYRFACDGCNYQPFNAEKATLALNLHVIEIDEENPIESKCNILCKACHSTQHIDVAAEQGWIQIVNSTFSQKELIGMCRTNALQNSVTEDNTRHLKTPVMDFIKKIKDGSLPINTKAKVIFTNKFEWGDL